MFGTTGSFAGPGYFNDLDMMIVGNMSEAFYNGSVTHLLFLQTGNACASVQFLWAPMLGTDVGHRCWAPMLGTDIGHRCWAWWPKVKLSGGQKSSSAVGLLELGPVCFLVSVYVALTLNLNPPQVLAEARAMCGWGLG
jgi:hypothetical protein